MVAVAVVSVLSSVVIPLYKNFQVKSRFTEAKLLISNLSRAEEAFQGSYGFYTACFPALGITPPTEHYFSYGFGAITTADKNRLSNEGLTFPTCDSWVPGNTTQAIINKIGTKSIGFANAPAVDDISNQANRITVIGGAYFAFAAGNIGGSNTTIVWNNPLVSNAVASPVGGTGPMGNTIEPSVPFKTTVYAYHPVDGWMLFPESGDLSELYVFDFDTNLNEYTKASAKNSANGGDAGI
jgi:type II secretory pathway pseudopilin PulG